MQQHTEPPPPPRTEQSERFGRHDAARDARGRVLVRLSIPDVAPATLAANRSILFHSPSASGGLPEAVGRLALTPRWPDLHLDRICVRWYAEHRGFGTAALRALVLMGQAWRYAAIVGDAQPMDRDQLKRVRSWYAWCGFQVDHSGIPDRIVYDLAKPFRR